MEKNPYRIEKEELLEKLFQELEKDKNIISENLFQVMEEVMLVAKSENYIASIKITLREKQKILTRNYTYSKMFLSVDRRLANIH